MAAKLTFNDNFDSLSIWNGSSGTWSTNWWYNDEWGNYSKSNGGTLTGNGEQQWYINANYAGTASVKPWNASGGVLTLSAAPASASIQSQINGYQYTSGMVNTWHSFSQQYGYFEMRADMPAGQGLWPAFWLMPKDGSWPPELDVVEVLGNDPSRIYTTAHTNQTGTHTMSSLGTTVADTSAGYHTYAVDWRADKLTWYFDGKQVYQTATPADMQKPMYMIANLAVGGSWPGSPNATTHFPAEMKIDYIRAWDSNPYTNGGVTTDTGSTPVTSTPTTSPAPATGGTSSGAGQVLTASGAYAQLTGGSGADTLISSDGANTLTGGAGADSFVIAKEPWAPIHITDFVVGTDKLDLSALFKASGYTGSDPVRDGYVQILGDGAGGTIVRFDRDGVGTAQKWPNTIVQLDHLSPNGVTWAQLQGSAAAPASAPASAPAAAPVSTAPSGSGLVLTSDTVNSKLIGTSGADTLNASQGGDTLTGGAGADRFVFGSEPWAPVHVMDFTPGQDKLDLSALFAKSGYAGQNPVADHYVYVVSDGAGGSLIRFDRDAGGSNPVWPNTIIDLHGVAPSQVSASDWIIH